MKNEKILDVNLMVGGQPAPEDIESLRKRHVGAIINLRNAGEDGGRAGVMGLLHLAIKHGWGVEHAKEQAKQRGVPLEGSPYQAFFEDYLRRHSPAER